MFKSKITLAIIFLISILQLTSSLKAVYCGGGVDDDNEAIYNAFIQLSTPEDGEPFIGIITAASDESEATPDGQDYTTLLQETYGVKNVMWLPITITEPNNTNSTELADIVANMTGIFFGGGDQERIKGIMMTNNSDGTHSDSLVLSIIRERILNDQMAVLGTSAGTDIQQAVPMITGGLSWFALAYGSYHYSDEPDNSDLLTFDPTGGFGFYNYSFLDTHVGTRGREGRMIRLIHDNIVNGTWGIGIDENTAIVIQDDVLEIAGYNGAYVYDLTNSSQYLTNSSYFSIQNISLSYLTSGDQFNLLTKEVTFATWKSDIAGKEQRKAPKYTIDIFSEWNNITEKIMNPEMFTNITTDLMNSADANTTYGYTFDVDPTFRVDFDKTNAYGVIGYQGTTPYISFTNMQVRIYALTQDILVE